jgi:hypothetical protein
MIVSKQFEVLNEAVPTATVIGCLLNPDNPNSEIQRERPRRPRAGCIENLKCCMPGAFWNRSFL